MSNSLWPHGLCRPWNSPDQNTGVGSLSLLQGIFPIQGLNPGLLHWRWILYQLCHQGSPRILEWVAYPFSRNRTGVSCIADGFFTNWAIREALIQPRCSPVSSLLSTHRNHVFQLFLSLIVVMWLNSSQCNMKRWLMKTSHALHGWTIVSQDRWSNSILDISVRMF